MRRIILLGFLFFHTLVFGSSFQQAEALFQSGQVREAIALYEKAGVAQQYNGAYWYNLGTLYAHSNQIGKGLRAFYAAEKRNPGQKDLVHNIALLESKVSGRIVPQLTFKSVLNRFVALATPMTWLSATLLFLLLANIGFFVMHWRVRWRYAKGMTLGAGGAAVFFGCFLALSYCLVPDSAVVMAPKSALFSGPSENLSVLFYVHEGQRVDVAQSALSYLKVVCPNGVEGWIRQSDVSLVP